MQLLLLVCMGLVTACGLASGELQLLQVLYRHGARSPITWFPGDPNNAHWWLGPGQLTNQGKRNQYELGGFLRSRYARFLNDSYHANYTYVRSTDVDRTLMSAAVNLAALYSPLPDQQWNDSLPWQPVPVHTRPGADDLMLRFVDSCPRFVKAQQKLQRSQRMRRLNEQYAPLYRYVTERSGVPVADVLQASSVYDTLWIEASQNLTLPEWAVGEPVAPYGQSVYPHLLAPLSDISFQMLGWSSTLRRLGGGQLLADMTSNMEAAAAGRLQPPQRQLFVYSAHDFNVAALLAALDVYNGLKPPLASCVMVELHATAGQHSVAIFYRNSTALPPHPLRLPGCADPCPLSDFVRLTAGVRPADPRVECGLSAAESTRTLLQYVAAGALLLALVAVCGCLLCRCHRKRSADQQAANNYRYSSLQQVQEQ